MTSWTRILRLPGYALGPILFSTMVAVAEAPPGSVYVPLDSWVYPAFDRLAGLGTINKQFVGLRPWTRIQCAQLVLDADANMENAEVTAGESVALFAALKQEFSVEINVLNGGSARQAGVESVYTRSMGITGTPLRDGYNFGQTVANDFGRPFNTGFNNVSGFSAQAVRGRFFAYIRGEYQHSPAYAGLTTTQQSYLARLNGTPSAPYSQAAGAVNQFALLDTYVGMRLGIFDVTFGKQSLWCVRFQQQRTLHRAARTADLALFPSRADDKKNGDMVEVTGSKTILVVHHRNRSRLWEPFSERGQGIYRTRRNLYKNFQGNKLIFEEINEDLSMTFRYGWFNSNRFGFIRRACLAPRGRT